MLRHCWASLLAVTVACGGQIDPTAIDKTNTGQTGFDGDEETKTPSVPTASPPGSGPTAPGGVGCNGTAIPFKEGFENGLGDRFKFTSKTSYSLEYDGPIDGLQSLRVKSGPAVYMTHPMASACSASVTFTIRASAETVKSGMVLANLDAGSREVSISMTAGDGTISMFQTAKLKDAIGGGGGGPIFKTTIVPDVPTTISLTVDLTTRKMTATIGTALSSQPPELYEQELMGGGEEMEPPAFKTLAIGNGPTGVPSATGLYILDSIVVQ